jgi:hypothetical protein
MNGDIMDNVICEIIRTSMTQKMEYLNDKMNYLGTNGKNKNINRLRIGTCGGSSEHSNEPLGSIKSREFN